MDNPFILIVIGTAVVAGSILRFRLHAFLALALGALVVGVLTPQSLVEAYDGTLAVMTVSSRLAKGFGDTCASIGIIIAMACIIGTAMIETGAAERVVRSSLKVVGERMAPIAFLCSAFLLSIPIFFDTVFLMMIPLAKAMAARTNKNYIAYVTAIIAGGVMAHSLVPPTPGPLQIAHELNVSYMDMTWCGLLVGAFTATSGLLYGLWANRRWNIPVRPTADLSIEELHELAAKEDCDLPSLWVSVLPVLLPLLLIGVASAVGNTSLAQSLPTSVVHLIAFLGEKNIALICAATVALILLARRSRGSQQAFGDQIQKSLFNAGVIILIVGAGGAFGLMLKATNVALHIRDLSSGVQMGLLPLAWLVTAVIRTAQGSATVAMITAAGIVGGLAAQGLSFHPVYLAVAIGCGSKPFWWMNDSGFWVVCRMSGWQEGEMLRIGSVCSLIMGLVGLPLTMLLAWLFPLAG